MYPGSYSVNSDLDVKLLGAPYKVSVSQVSEKVFQAGVVCSEGVAVFQGGYATVPTDLQDAATRMTIKAYHESNGDHHRNIALIPSVLTFLDSPQLDLKVQKGE